MLTNLWNIISFYCMHNHEKPIKMVVMQGPSSPFYACPRYMRKDTDHPNGHEENERACANRLNFIDATNIVTQFSKQIEEDMEDGMMVDYTNYTFQYKQIEVKVLKYTDQKIKLGIINRKAIKE